jgi:hypothetical protein
MADLRVKFVVTGSVVTTLDYSIVPVPEPVAAEIQALIARANFDKIKDEVSGVGGPNEANVVLNVNGNTLLNQTLSIKKIAKIEAKLINMLSMLLAKHS